MVDKLTAEVAAAASDIFLTSTRNRSRETRDTAEICCVKGSGYKGSGEVREDAERNTVGNQRVDVIKVKLSRLQSYDDTSP